MKKFRFAAAAIGTGILVSLTACSGQSPQVQESSQTESQEVAENTAASQAEKDPIEIATKPMTEQYILGEMLKILIEDSTDYTVNVTQGIGGGTSNIHPAMEAGEFDL